MAGKARTQPKNRDQQPGLREHILRACMEGLTNHFREDLRGASSIGQSGPSTIHVRVGSIDFDVQVFERHKRRP
jgi:hypothetical protein